MVWRGGGGGRVADKQAIIKLEIDYLKKWVIRMSHMDLYINRTLGIA